MEQKYRTILLHHWANIRENLEPRNILPKLVTVLKETDYDEIREQSTRQERCDKLIDILPRRGKNAFDVFVNALKSEVPHLASELTEAEKLETEREAKKEHHIKTSQELEELKSACETLKTINQQLSQIIQQQRDESSSPYEGLKKERDFARRENQTLEKEIEELRKKSEDYERENQALRKEQQEMMRQLQRKDEELEEKVTNRTSEFEKMLAREQKLRKNAEDCLEKSLAETKAKDVLLENMSAENKHLQDESNAKRSKCDDLREEVRLNLRLSGEITGHKGTESELRHRENSAKLQGENCKLKTELEAEKQDHIKTSQELIELKSLYETSKTETSEHIEKLNKIIQQLRDESSQALQKEKQEKIRQLQRKIEELEDKVTNKTSELKEPLTQITQQHRDEACSSCEALRNERDSTIREFRAVLEQLQELTKGISKTNERLST